MYRKTLKNPSGVIIMFPVEMVEADPILDTPTEQTWYHFMQSKSKCGHFDYGNAVDNSA